MMRSPLSRTSSRTQGVVAASLMLLLSSCSAPPQASVPEEKVMAVAELSNEAKEATPEEKLPGNDEQLKRPLWVTPKHLRMRSQPARQQQPPVVVEEEAPKAHVQVPTQSSKPKTTRAPRQNKNQTDKFKGNYPAAKAAKSKRPSAKPSTQRVAVKSAPRQPGRAPSGGPGSMGVQGELSWNSLPADGPGMNGHLKVRVKAPSKTGQNAAKRNLVVVMDVSGSMGVSLDRIATPVALMMDNLNAQDRAVVVAFSNKSRVFSSDTRMETYLRDLVPLTKARWTDLLVGMRKGLEELKKGRAPGRVDQIVILTDGITGDRRTLIHKERLIGLCKKSRTPIEILGYGNKCNRKLLADMARAGRGKFTHISDVGLLLESVMGDVLGLSGVSSRDNLLILEIAPGVSAHSGFILGRNGRKLGRLQVTNNRIQIPLGDFREGQELEIVLELNLPKGEVGIAEIAKARVEYVKPNGKVGRSGEAQIRMEYTESWQKPSKNPRMKDVLFQTQQAGKKA